MARKEPAGTTTSRSISVAGAARSHVNSPLTTIADSPAAARPSSGIGVGTARPLLVDTGTGNATADSNLLRIERPHGVDIGSCQHVRRRPELCPDGARAGRAFGYWRLHGQVGLLVGGKEGLDAVERHAGVDDLADQLRQLEQRHAQHAE